MSDIKLSYSKPDDLVYSTKDICKGNDPIYPCICNSTIAEEGFIIDKTKLPIYDLRYKNPLTVNADSLSCILKSADNGVCNGQCNGHICEPTSNSAKNCICKQGFYGVDCNSGNN